MLTTWCWNITACGDDVSCFLNRWIGRLFYQKGASLSDLSGRPIQGILQTKWVYKQNGFIVPSHQLAQAQTLWQMISPSICYSDSHLLGGVLSYDIQILYYILPTVVLFPQHLSQINLLGCFFPSSLIFQWWCMVDMLPFLLTHWTMAQYYSLSHGYLVFCISACADTHMGV